MTQNPSKDINKTIYVQKDMSQQNYLSPYEDDTIDLFELLITIWNWKLLIFLIFNSINILWLQYVNKIIIIRINHFQFQIVRNNSNKSIVSSSLGDK